MPQNMITVKVDGSPEVVELLRAAEARVVQLYAERDLAKSEATQWEQVAIENRDTAQYWREKATELRDEVGYWREKAKP
jgi:hypothetical protein